MSICFIALAYQWHRLVNNIGGKPKYWGGQRVTITDESIGGSELFRACVQAAPQSLHLCFLFLSFTLRSNVLASERTSLVLMLYNSSVYILEFYGRCCELFGVSRLLSLSCLLYSISYFTQCSVYNLIGIHSFRYVG